MITKNLKTLEDFQALKKGDILVCKFHRDTYKLAKRTRFASYEVQENKIHQKEIILQKQNNVYFNYECFLMGDSNLISAMLIRDAFNVISLGEVGKNKPKLLNLKTIKPITKMTLNKSQLPESCLASVSGSVTANELRIGNIYEYFVLDKLDPLKKWWEIVVCDATDLVYLENNPNDRYFRFIPITTDWLLLNGYKQMPSGNYLQPNSGNFVWFEKDLKCSIAGEIEVNHIRYVHQLQNLYFSITGLELPLVSLTDR